MTGRIVRGLAGVERVPSALAIGFFDGVHVGHQALIQRAVARAEERGLRSIALTFDPHPMAVLRPERAPRLLMTAERRAQILRDECGVDLVVLLPFDAERARQTAEAFEHDVIYDLLDARVVVVGDNFRFGAQAAGDTQTLEDLCEPRGVDVEVLDLVRSMDGVQVSSTAIRRALTEDGDVAWAGLALGRPYAIEGTVVHGDQRGRTIGFPTANVEVSPERLVPARGVYAGWAFVEGERTAMVTNIGTRPTFDGDGTTIEVHLLDVARDLYDLEVEAVFVDRIRDEVRFGSVDELVAQIGRDVETARRLLRP